MSLTRHNTGDRAASFEAPSNAPLTTARSATSIALDRQYAAEAGENFAQDGNQIAALRAVVVLLSRGVALPPSIARWLAGGLVDYLQGEAKSIEAALCLDMRGKANPRRKATERREFELAMFMMQTLHMMGATIPQAAAMVVRLEPGHKQSTLKDRYGRSGRGADAIAARAAPNIVRWGVWIQWWVDPLPDDGGDVADRKNPIRLGKARIKSMYAKHAASST